MDKYEDIIDLPRHEPDEEKHPRMDVYNRAAQFAPFAALTGFEESIDNANLSLDDLKTETPGQI